MNISGNLVQNIIIGFLFVIWVFVMGLGLRNGQYAAQGRYISKTVTQVLAGLKYFYSDQGRYPTESEFANSDVMIVYIFPFSLLQFTSGNCSGSFFYGQDTIQTFRFMVCVPTDFANLRSGINMFRN